MSKRGVKMLSENKRREVMFRNNTEKELQEMDVIPINKQMNILFDGRQFMVRLPKEVVDYFKIEKGDVFEFDIKINNEGSENKFYINKK